MAVYPVVAVPANAHRINAWDFSENVVVVSMMTVEIVLPLAGRTEIFTFVIG
jgi:hypothetical protein